MHLAESLWNGREPKIQAINKTSSIQAEPPSTGAGHPLPRIRSQWPRSSELEVHDGTIPTRCRALGLFHTNLVPDLDPDRANLGRLPYLRQKLLIPYAKV